MLIMQCGSLASNYYSDKVKLSYPKKQKLTFPFPEGW